MTNDKHVLAEKIKAFLLRFDPEEFSEETSGTRAEELATKLAEELVK